MCNAVFGLLFALSNISFFFCILARTDIKVFLKDFTEVFGIAETGHFGNFGDGVLLFLQQLHGTFQAYQPYIISRRWSVSAFNLL